MIVSEFINRKFLPSNIKYENVGMKHHTIENSERCEELILINSISVEKEYSVVSFYANRDSERIIFCHMYVYDGIPEYVCFSGPMLSMDGEFRNKLISYIQWEEMYAEDDILEGLESKIAEKYEDDFEFKIFGPECTSKFENYLVKSRIGLQLFTTSWFMTMFETIHNIRFNHENPKFLRVMIDIPLDRDLYNKYFSKIENRNIFKLFITMSSFVYPVESRLMPSIHYILGQKIVPLKAIEYAEFGNIRHSIWREFYCTIKATDLLINNVAQGIPDMCGAFLIKSDKDMFDNGPIIRKFERSERDKVKFDAVMKNNPDMEFYDALSLAFKDPAKILKDNDLLSDYSIVLVTHFMGRTWADMPNALLYTKYVRLGNLFGNISLLHRYTFDILYNIAALNKIGIIQGDLHMNNCTIHACQATFTTMPNSSISYTIGKKTYVFPHNGFSSCIIDFSRSILNQKKHNSKKSPDLTKDFIDNIKSSINNYMPDEAPDLIPYIDDACERDIESVFNCFTMFDVYVFGIRLKKLLSTITYATKSHSDFCDDLITYSRDQLMQLPGITRGAVFTSPVIDLIHRTFSKYEGVPKTARICSHWQLNNDMEYTISNFDKWPSYMQEFKVTKIKNIEDDPDVIKPLEYTIIKKSEMMRIFRDKIKFINKINTGYHPPKSSKRKEILKLIEHDKFYDRTDFFKPEKNSKNLDANSSDDDLIKPVKSQKTKSKKVAKGFNKFFNKIEKRSKRKMSKRGGHRDSSSSSETSSGTSSGTSSDSLSENEVMRSENEVVRSENEQGREENGRPWFANEVTESENESEVFNINIEESKDESDQQSGQQSEQNYDHESSQSDDQNDDLFAKV